MPDWQSELEALLSQLQVSFDPATDEPVEHADQPLTDLDTIEEADADGDVPWELAALAPEEASVDDDEVSAVRSEIEATLQRVIVMTQQGRMERALRDDVVFVLQALTRPHPPFSPEESDAPGDEAHQEWHLASAAAVLRFCRVVLRLTDALERDDEV